MTTPKPMATTPRAAKSVSHAVYMAVEGVGSGQVPSVAGPGLGVLRRVLLVALDHPRVQPGAVQPLSHPLAPGRGRGPDLPVGEQLGDAPWLQDGVQGPHQSLHERVAGRPAVAVLVQRHLARRAG